MHFTLTAVAQLFFLSSIAEARHGRGKNDVREDKNWAGVNSFFLHAFPEYETIDSYPKNCTDSNLTDQLGSKFLVRSKPPT
jgi:hypothetical protein